MYNIRCKATRGVQDADSAFAKLPSELAHNIPLEYFLRACTFTLLWKFSNPLQKPSKTPFRQIKWLPQQK